MQAVVFKYNGREVAFFVSSYVTVNFIRQAMQAIGAKHSTNFELVPLEKVKGSLTIKGYDLMKENALTPLSAHWPTWEYLQG